MKIFKKRYLWITITLVVLLIAASVSLAQSAGGYDLSWWTVESGGLTSGGGYSLHGVIGQPDAGSARGGEYALAGGFLSRFSIFDFWVFIPLILR